MTTGWNGVRKSRFRPRTDPSELEPHEEGDEGSRLYVLLLNLCSVRRLEFKSFPEAHSRKEVHPEFRGRPPFQSQPHREVAIRAHAAVDRRGSTVIQAEPPVLVPEPDGEVHVPAEVVEEFDARTRRVGHRPTYVRDDKLVRDLPIDQQ